MSTINNTTEVEHRYRHTNKEEKPNNASNLDKDAFLNLLVTQLKNQDPLNPMEDRDFIAQMAQFSALEQMQNLNETVKTTKETISQHITMMNNNMVKSQTEIANILSEIKKGLEIGKEDLEDTNKEEEVEVEQS
ncbi:flagellar hook assembly protein FlgD [Natronincola ferrireducens]|uniref:Flagellar basal-body rod modification protein FlgD n=1 Tax=Natronincola ferrireducens TaxID=393762 RepID=A0A1G9C1T8_9FIRM|nr:flagellar hook capping FlgD N-terminal domain-containing protein [Natronincola ferrireducens]SDK45434.1 flagellar basal-body rod modification protein FlgD [Natronincola ferrireducens]